MKYIRTKDEIFECEDKEQYKYLETHYEIINQAYTIEELCDVFIKKSKDGDDYFQTGTDAFTVFDKKYEYYKKWFEYYDYYGAIWTDKGLIYVAKLNKKGKLELL